MLPAWQAEFHELDSNGLIQIEDTIRTVRDLRGLDQTDYVPGWRMVALLVDGWSIQAHLSSMLCTEGVRTRTGGEAPKLSGWLNSPFQETAGSRKPQTWRVANFFTRRVNWHGKSRP